MKMPSAYFAFDLIGTLFDAKNVYVRAFTDACQIHGLSSEGHDVSVGNSIGNKRLSEIVAEIFPDMPPQKFSEFQVTCNELRDARLMTDCQPFPDALEAVSYLRSIGLETALITGTSESGMRALIERFDLSKLFSKENIFYRNLETDADIPNEELKFQQLCEILNRDEGKSVSLVGDSMSDREAACFPYFDFWAFVPDSSTTLDAFQKSVIPEQIFSSYRQFIEIIKSYEARIAHLPEPAPI